MQTAKKYTILLFLLSNYSNAQTIYIGGGKVHSLTNQTERMVNSKDAFLFDYYQKVIGIEYSMPHKFCLFASFSKYDVATYIRLDKTHYVGYYGGKITRSDWGLSYNILKEKNRIYITPFVAAGFQYTKKTFYTYGELVPILGPNYYQTKYPTSEGHDNLQMVPIVGYKAGIHFLKKYEFGICMLGVYGHRAFQKFYFDYTYRNDPIPRKAVFESRGTGLYSSFFLGMSLFKKKFNP